jgi:DNA helicase II / ATP-dependent DNA helicase PcrA
VWTANAEGHKIKVIAAASQHPSIPADSIEATEVARSIQDIQANHQARYSDFAILYRANALSRAMEEALRKKNIPYKIYGGLSFYQRKSVKDLLAYFRLALNPHDEEAFRRVINYPARGIGDTTLDKITIASRDNDVSMWTVCENIADFKLTINSGTLQKIADFVTMVQGFAVRVSGESAYAVGKHIATTSGILRDLYNDKTPEGVSHYENVEELLNGLKEFSDGENAQAIELFENDPELARHEVKDISEGNEADLGPLRTLDQYMQDIALLTDSDKKESEEDKNKVALMTIHAAKGLEFPYVFVIGLEENLFPSALSINSRPELEEERRLFYVALTRAEKQCILSWARTRYKWGNLISCERSRFIDEIDEQFLELAENKLERKATFSELHANSNSQNPNAGIIKKKTLIRATAINSAPAPIDNSHLKTLQIGQRVRHERFGDGQVTQLEGSFPNTKATVIFDQAGQKQLLLKFAKLDII